MKTPLHIHGCLLAVAVLGIACGPSPGATTTSDSGSSSGATSEEPSTTAGPGGTSDATTSETDETQTTAGTTSDSEGETTATSGVETDTIDPSETDADTEGIDECPLPQEVAIAFELEPPAAMIEEECTVAELSEGIDAFTLKLACDLGSYTLSVTSAELGVPALSPGTEVHLSYAQAMGEAGRQRWIAVLHDGHAGVYKTIFGAVSAGRLDPPGSTIGKLFVSPLVTVADGVCDPRDTPCGPVERVGLRFFDEAFEQDAVVFDQSTGLIAADFVSSTLAVVERAVIHPVNTCDEAPETWFEFGISWTYFGP